MDVFKFTYTYNEHIRKLVKYLDDVSCPHNYYHNLPKPLVMDTLCEKDSKWGLYIHTHTHTPSTFIQAAVMGFIPSCIRLLSVTSIPWLFLGVDYFQ